MTREQRIEESARALVDRLRKMFLSTETERLTNALAAALAAPSPAEGEREACRDEKLVPLLCVLPYGHSGPHSSMHLRAVLWDPAPRPPSTEAPRDCPACFLDAHGGEINAAPGHEARHVCGKPGTAIQADRPAPPSAPPAVEEPRRDGDERHGQVIDPEGRVWRCRCGLEFARHDNFLAHLAPHVRLAGRPSPAPSAGGETRCGCDSRDGGSCEVCVPAPAPKETP